MSADLRPILGTIIVCGVVLVFMVTGIIGYYCCCRQKKKKSRHRRPPSPEMAFESEFEVPQAFLHPPAVNPNYQPTPRLARPSAPEYPGTNSSYAYHQSRSSNRSTLPPPEDFGPPAYDDVIVGGMKYPLTAATAAGDDNSPQQHHASSPSTP